MLRESRVPDVPTHHAMPRPRPPRMREVAQAVMTMALAVLCLVALTASTIALGVLGPVLFAAGVTLALVEAHVLTRRSR